MAQVANSFPGRGNAIFASVFSGSNISPRRHENKRIKLSAEPAAITQELRRSFKALLGIESSSTYAFGLNGPTAEGQPFRVPIAQCEPMNKVRRPNQADFLQQRSKLLKTPVWQSMKGWQSQLGSVPLKKLIAVVLDQLLGQYVRSAYRGCYRSDVVPHMEFWIQHVFTALVRLCLEVLGSSPKTTGSLEDHKIDLGDMKRWQDIALTNLGALRVDELYEMIMSWDENVNGINDLRRFTTSPATRSYLTTHFTETLASKLLHPGASTIEILHYYISIIRAFRRLDPKGVLLDRVARRVRKYLKDRDDTVRVIVGGLLSDPYDANGQPIPYDGETLSEIALELSRRDASNAEEDGELDWDNMNWLPDPIDAAPDYMKSKNTDVIGSLTSLFESKDIFVKELQNALADRLLKNKPNFDLEIGVVEHLKTRFGSSALQGCEVMLRDVLDSRKLDDAIRKEQLAPTLAQQSETQDEMTPELHAKILSRLFWPSISNQAFKLPLPITAQQSTYEQGFEALKSSRKLTWLNSIGHVEVELRLADRTITEEVIPYQASVIYAFQTQDQDQDQDDPQPQTQSLSVAQLASQLEMSPTLARSACIFWLSRRVLIETSTDVYSVLETLPDSATNPATTGTTTHDTDTPMSNSPHHTPLPPSDPTISLAAAAAAAEAADALATHQSQLSARKAQMSIYNNFILSMLTNQGAMPLPRIAMMLGIVVPGGFPFSSEELKEFLAGMVREGSLEVGMGGNYRVVG